jgi:pimeloyl-ACP methyl ester carboxylesterase
MLQAAVLAGMLMWSPGGAPAQRLDVAGHEDAFYVEPKDSGEQPVIMVLHPRNGDPREDCLKWAELASSFGWVLCPSGSLGADGTRSWGKTDDAKAVVDAAFDALRARFGSRVRAGGNLIIGFSEGALVAQLVGLQEAERWSRWLILGASDKYWGGEGALSVLQGQRRKLARVVMLTGEHDPVLEHSLRAGAQVRAARIPVRVIVRKGLGHEVPADKMSANYLVSMRWLFDIK